jgi:hypothetical protein
MDAIQWPSRMIFSISATLVRFGGVITYVTMLIVCMWYVLWTNTSLSLKSSRIQTVYNSLGEIAISITDCWIHLYFLNYWNALSSLCWLIRTQLAIYDCIVAHVCDRSPCKAIYHWMLINLCCLQENAIDRSELILPTLYTLMFQRVRYHICNATLDFNLQFPLSH